ncbi:hypothetical protein ACFQ36_17545 [Arthrobacter sp. GCM10027362]|uniref:hypothetical protein n=1 Tax=Arthrobacter sp. GCM10027362 TaxID=3273379 RepID=UPI003625EEF8
MPAERSTVAVIGAGGKLGMRVSANLQQSAHAVFSSDTELDKVIARMLKLQDVRH